MFIGPVKVFHFRQGGGAVDGGGQLIRQLALVFDGLLYLVPAVLEVAQVLQAVGQLTDELVVHGPVELLAVAGDEGDGVSLVQQGDDVFNVLGGTVQFPGQNLYYCFHLCLLVIVLRGGQAAWALSIPHFSGVEKRKKRLRQSSRSRSVRISGAARISERPCPAGAGWHSRRGGAGCPGPAESAGSPGPSAWRPGR